MSDINVNLGGDIVRLLLGAEKLYIYLKKEWKINWHKPLLTNLNQSYRNEHFGWAYLYQTHVIASITTLINVDTECRFPVHGQLFEHLKEGESMLFLFYFKKKLKGTKRELISPTQNLLTHLSIRYRACVTPRHASNSPRKFQRNSHPKRSQKSQTYSRSQVLIDV